MSTDTVVVTGASTGIGRAIVEHLAERQVRVVAAVRDLSTVLDHPLVDGVRLDVTSDGEAREAAATVERLVGPDGIRGLVNNAGIAVGGPLEFLDLDDLRRQLDVNVVGQVAVTQAFIPLLRRHRLATRPDRRALPGRRGPRIVFTSSISGRIGVPFLAPYAASKHAVNAIAEAVRRELMPWNIGASVLAPATVSTPIWDKAQHQVAEVTAAMPERAHSLYGDQIERMRTMTEEADGVGIPPSDVARAAHHALFSRFPRAEYLVGAEAKIGATIEALTPTPLFDRIVDRQLRG